jgi:[Skp1-protein]-hydroxyproline N-acetylglucosaminyltransferase
MDTIFVSIASYRDSELPKTIENLIKNAKEPNLLKIVVFEQNDESDQSIYGIYPSEQVQVIRCHFSEAKGPNYARAIIQKEYKNEKYFLQIDSHTRFINYWDVHLKHLLDLVPEPSVLTQYPPEYSLNSNDLNTESIRSGLYIQGFGLKDRFTRIQSDIINLKNKRNYPYTSKAWAACFSFSKGSIVKDAPYDISLEHLFFGEELDITLKLYTRGYYFFSPHYTIVFTLFKRNHRRTYWQDIPVSERSSSELNSRNKLWKRILNYEIGPNSYGTIRTIDDYKKFACIESFIDSKLTKNAKAFRRHTARKLYK